MKFFDDYFVFSSKEKKGILTLVIIILLMIIAYRVIPNVFKPEIQDFTEVRALIEAMNSEIESEKATSLFKFNPNIVHAHLSSMELLASLIKFFYPTKIKLVITKHLDSFFLEASRGKNSLIKGMFIDRFILKNSDKIICVSKQ